jgi:PhzF family phenazine biosynthesis protein
MKLAIYHLDTFTNEVFKGNPAAICPLPEWLADDVLLKIAAENNLSETGFYVIKEDNVEIRWFTPAVEVDLCGHATLGSAFAIYNYENYGKDIINFYSPRSGNLSVTVKQDKFVLNFPTDKFKEIELTDELISATDKTPIAAFKGKTDYMLVFDKQEDIETIQPNLSFMAGVDVRGFIVTAKGKTHDFVSRFFGPAVGVNEDPVCGSAHTTLVPYWANQLGKTELKALQVSKRSGELHCRYLGERVELGGTAVLYMKGEIYI